MNTSEQIAAHEKNEAQAALEATWPIYEVGLIGDPVPWKARGNPDYWVETETNSGIWVARPQNELPDHATVVEGEIVMAARCSVVVHARNEDHAKSLALKAEPDYHTIEGVRCIAE